MLLLLPPALPADPGTGTSLPAALRADISSPSPLSTAAAGSGQLRAHLPVSVVPFAGSGAWETPTAGAPEEAGASITLHHKETARVHGKSPVGETCPPAHLKVLPAAGAGESEHRCFSGVCLTERR